MILDLIICFAFLYYLILSLIQILASLNINFYPFKASDFEKNLLDKNKKQVYTKKRKKRNNYCIIHSNRSNRQF